jgi:hypothetical protein
MFFDEQIIPVKPSLLKQARGRITVEALIQGFHAEIRTPKMRSHFLPILCCGPQVGQC